MPSHQTEEYQSCAIQSANGTNIVRQFGPTSNGRFAIEAGNDDRGGGLALSTNFQFSAPTNGIRATPINRTQAPHRVERGHLLRDVCGRDGIGLHLAPMLVLRFQSGTEARAI